MRRSTYFSLVSKDVELFKKFKDNLLICNHNSNKKYVS